MIISLISSVLGIAGGLIPDIFKEIKATREHTRELAFMDKQSDLQLKLLEKKTDAKLAELDANVVVEEMRAFGKQMNAIYKQQQPIGNSFVDGFNALIRPTCAFLIMVMFFIIAGLYAWGVVSELGSANMTTVADVLWGSLIGDSIQAVLGYLFGYRTTKGRISEIRSALK
tara:strand:- start:1813 stop:2325 length:513 start_codon:yes stop_codon:yes gene_type:complete